MKNQKRIYLDNAATTPLDEDVKKVMVETMEVFGNPSSMYAEGRKANAFLQEARSDIANILNAQADEIIFTGSGTESDNLAIFGAVYANQKKGKHIITTKIEHHAVLYPFEKLEKEGFEVTYLNIDSKGQIDLEELKSALRDDTIFVSVMYVNNEIGSVQPIKEISEILKIFRQDLAVKPVFHTENRPL